MSSAFRYFFGEFNSFLLINFSIFEKSLSPNISLITIQVLVELLLKGTVEIIMS